MVACFAGVRLGSMLALSSMLFSCAVLSGCGGDFESDGYAGGAEWAEESSAEEEAQLWGEAPSAEVSELGTSQQELFFNPFNFVASCSDRNGINSVMAALAVAAATELGRWQPTKDFKWSNGGLALTSTGKARCADGKCWNTQALLDLQKAPAGKVEVRPGVFLDASALKSALSSNMVLQILHLISSLVPDHKFELKHSERGGCDQLYWFNVTSPSGGAISSVLTSTLSQKLHWVGGSGNPYIQFQSSGTMVGIDPTYGLNESGATMAGSCSATCTKISSRDISGGCCSCNGTKRFARSAWSPATYVCK